MFTDFSEEKVFPDYNPECARLAKVFTWGESDSVGFATHLPMRAVHGESTHLPRAQVPWEIEEIFLKGLSALCG